MLFDGTISVDLGSMSAMVGVTGENRKAAIQLLGEDHAGKFVRQGHLSQRQQDVGLLTSFITPAVCGTNHKNQFLGAAVTVRADEASEFFGTELFTTGVE